MKILYSIGSLAQKGGTEKVFANKANYFIEKLVYEVHILVHEYDFECAKVQKNYKLNCRIFCCSMAITSYF